MEQFLSDYFSKRKLFICRIWYNTIYELYLIFFVNNFEFDKICWAIITGIVVLILSSNLSKLLYSPASFLKKRGYQIEINSESVSNVVANAVDILTAKLDIKAIMEKADSKNGEKNIQ